MTLRPQIDPRHIPPLDPEFVPAAAWNRAYEMLVAEERRDARRVVICIARDDGIRFLDEIRILSDRPAARAATRRYVERRLKFLLWQKGGNVVGIHGAPELAAWLRRVYSPRGARRFDVETVGERMFGRPIEVTPLTGRIPSPRESTRPLGRHLDGCRIGFDLGGSDRKAAALIDGKVVFSEEIAWAPYFEADPHYHLQGIEDTLRRAAAHLPRVDAIGGSAAGIYVNNEVRLASLFRGVPRDAFDRHVRRLFVALRTWWGDIPFDVINDGEVTALAGSMALDATRVLGVSMGTSVAGGYVDARGNITSWINELAFVPVDYRDDAPADEWSGDTGCAVQYFSQQGVRRLLPKAGIDTPADMPDAERLVRLQELMRRGDPRAARVYETIGVCFGHAIAQFAAHYDAEHLLLLGRVLSGEGGEILRSRASDVLAEAYPDVAERIELHIPDERERRHGQAVAAASLPELHPTSLTPAPQARRDTTRRPSHTATRSQNR